MRLALASQGFTTDEIAKKIEELVGCPLEKMLLLLMRLM